MYAGLLFCPLTIFDHHMFHLTSLLRTERKNPLLLLRFCFRALNSRSNMAKREQSNLHSTFNDTFLAPGGRPSNNSQDSIIAALGGVAPRRSKQRSKSNTPNERTASEPPSRALTPATAPRADTTTSEPPEASAMASQRSRNRGLDRWEDREAINLWEEVQAMIRQLVEDFNSSNDATRDIIAKDKQVSHKNKQLEHDAGGEDMEGIKKGMTTAMTTAMDTLDAALRKGVKISDSVTLQLKAVTEKIEILRALVREKESKTAQSVPSGSSRSSNLVSGSGRNATRAGAKDKDRERDRERDRDRDRDRDHDRDKAKEKEKEKDKEKEREKEKERDKAERDLYDFDGAGDSPMPSPVGAHARKLGGGGSSVAGGAGPSSDRSGNRDSVPPRSGDRDTPSKADSVEPQAYASTLSAAGSVRAKVVFVKGQDVVFKPKPVNPTETREWYLGKVQQVIGEGKARRYKVKDEDPDQEPEDRKEYKISASNMIPLPAAGAEAIKLENGKTVLALYPDSTTFYKAEVMGFEAGTGKVKLRFEGEETTGTLQLVERHYIVEYRD